MCASCGCGWRYAMCKATATATATATQKSLRDRALRCAARRRQGRVRERVRGVRIAIEHSTVIERETRLDSTRFDSTQKYASTHPIILVYADETARVRERNNAASNRTKRRRRRGAARRRKSKPERAKALMKMESKRKLKRREEERRGEARRAERGDERTHAPESIM